MVTSGLDTKMFNSDIRFAVKKYCDHGTITRRKVIRWLKQFPSDHQKLAAKVLHCIDYYAEGKIHAMAKQLATTVYSTYSKTKKKKIWFVPIGGPGSGAQQVARHLKTVREVPKKCVIDLLTLQRANAANIDVVVAFDDFCGTGQLIRDWWNLNETIVRPKQAKLVLGLLVLNQPARECLEKIGDKVMAMRELQIEANVFHQACSTFGADEKDSLLMLCARTGCSNKYLKGRGECGLMIVFKHGCPNNTIPVLWYQNEGVWEALFQRRCT